MSTPLYQALLAYRKRGAARFHMPGHKGRAPAPFEELSAFDVTEVPGTDSLYEASGAIAKTERQYAELYGARHSVLSAGGSTLCIQTMLTLTCPPGSTVIASRNCHASAVNAMGLLDLTPVWMVPEGCGEFGPGVITAEMVSDALWKYPEAACVYVTSPDYFGILSDIPAIAGVCRGAGVPLLVDNAHGAHLRFLPGGSMHPMDEGADYCCDSLHKTLPVLTGGAVLHTAEDTSSAAMKEAMRVYGSTSPSYLILLSCDLCLDYLRHTAAADMAEAIRRVQELEELAQSRGFLLPALRRDPLKVLLSVYNTALDAESFGQRLRDYGMEPEYVSGTYAVLMASAFNSPRDYERLRRFLMEFDAFREPGTVQAGLSSAQRVMSVREAMFAPSRMVPVEEALGKTAAGAAYSCPPGVPVVVPGELIDENIEKDLKRYGISTIKVVE